VRSLAVTKSGTILASGSDDHTTILWNMDSYEQLFVFQEECPVSALAFSADDQNVFIGSKNGKRVQKLSNKLRY
jgi:WD40 repeat protein